jgi:hypothetical protein
MNLARIGAALVDAPFNNKPNESIARLVLETPEIYRGDQSVAKR